VVRHGELGGEIKGVLEGEEGKRLENCGVTAAPLMRLIWGTQEHTTPPGKDEDEGQPPRDEQRAGSSTITKPYKHKDPWKGLRMMLGQSGTGKRPCWGD